MYQKCSEKCEKAKSDYSENIVSDLKTSNPSQWYSKMKRIASYSQGKDTDPEVQDLIGLPERVQAEKIAEIAEIAEISNQYSPLESGKISLEDIDDDRPPPEINPYLIYLRIMSIKKKTSTVTGDIPMKLIRYCAEELSFPLSDIYTRAVLFGEYPNIYKLEIVTPAPKVYPPNSTKDLRKIAGTPNFSKIFEVFFG